MERATSSQNCNLLALVEKIGGALQVCLGGQSRAARKIVGGMVEDIVLGGLILFQRHRLDVNWKVDMGDAAITQRRATGEVSHIAYMSRPHDTRAIERHIGKDAVEIDVLLGKGVNQIVIMMTC